MIRKFGYYILVGALVLGIFTLVGYDKISSTSKSKNTKVIEKTVKVEKETEKKTINCIGDSLTLGNTKTSYPKALSTKGFTVNKYGGSQDQSIDGAIRMHGYLIYCENITIPASTNESVDVTIYSNEGEVLNVLKTSGHNFDSVTIDGIKGTLKYDSDRNVHTFNRSEAGEEHTVTGKTEIIADEYASLNKEDITIIWLGTFDRYHSLSIYRTVAHIQEIINAHQIDKYIVIGLTSKRRFEIVDDMNKILQENFKEHYMDFRTYLLNSGLNDAGIEATLEDQSDLGNRRIPSSLLDESKLNGNSQFNELLTNQLIDKMKELNYINN